MQESVTVVKIRDDGRQTNTAFGDREMDGFENCLGSGTDGTQ